MPPRGMMIILEDVETAFGRIKIFESPKERTRTFYQDACFHSRADFEGNSLIAYVHAMYGAILQAQARKVLVLGCAGGNLATMLAAAGCEVTMVDINGYTFDLAKRYFNLPDKVKCIEADARACLENTTETYDAIALDVFDAGEIPKHLRSLEFFQLMALRLHKGGIVTANAIVDHDLDMLADNVAFTLHKASGLPVVLLDELSDPDRNIVIVAGPAPDMAALVQVKQTQEVQKELRSMLKREVRRQAKVIRDA